MDTHSLKSVAPGADLSILRHCGASCGTSFQEKLSSLLQLGHKLPLPGSGKTLERWRHFAAVAAIDLTCAKLFESHADAIAILHELGKQDLIEDDALWAVWCAEPPSHRVKLSPHYAAPALVSVNGVKAWCSGADSVAHALISAWNEEDEQCLVAVHMDQPGVSVTTDGWHAVGMGPTSSVDVRFDQAIGVSVGAGNSYVNRPGFTHGAAGVAACWFGAAGAIAQSVVEHVKRRPCDTFALAHLGAIDIALNQAACLLSHAAEEIDAAPAQGHAVAVQRARLSVEVAVDTVLHRAPRAIGAGPLCKNPHLARLLADLPVFLRQSHADRDLATHGESIIRELEARPWTL